jgi:hypothetical protein
MRWNLRSWQAQLGDSGREDRVVEHCLWRIEDLGHPDQPNPDLSIHRGRSERHRHRHCGGLRRDRRAQSEGGSPQIDAGPVVAHRVVPVREGQLGEAVPDEFGLPQRRVRFRDQTVHHDLSLGDGQ